MPAPSESVESRVTPYCPGDGESEMVALSPLRAVIAPAGMERIAKMALSGAPWRITIVRPSDARKVTAVSGGDAPERPRTQTAVAAMGVVLTFVPAEAKVPTPTYLFD